MRREGPDIKYPKPKTERPKPKRRAYKPARFGEGMQPGTVEWELNRRRERKEEREAVRSMAEMEATRAEREREPRSVWGHIARIFRRYWRSE